MAAFGFTVYITWKGDEKDGKRMENILNAAFTYSDIEDNELDVGVDRDKVISLRQEISQKMYKRIPITDEFSEYALFGEYEEPHTLYCNWDDNLNFAPNCFVPLYTMFPELDFLAHYQQDYVSSEDYYKFYCMIYKQGKEIERYIKEYKSYNQYDRRCQKAKDERIIWLQKK